MTRSEVAAAGRALLARASAAVRESAWTAIAGRVALWSVAFFALALVGSGKILTWVPAVRAGSVAYAATPAPEASADAGVEPAPSADVDAGVEAPAAERVDLNRATEADLRRLPGVGPKKAAAILELRAKLGRFHKVEDLLRIKGIGRRSLARLRPLVTVDPA